MSLQGPTPSPQPAQICAVILDYGEVLCHLPSSEHIERFAQIFNMDPASFLPTYLRDRWPYDRGDLLANEYWDNFAVRAGVKLDSETLDEIRRLDVEMWCSHNESMIRWVEEIHSAGYKTAMLSNMPTDMIEHLRANFAWLDHFDHHIISAEVRSAKPEPAIYQHSIELLGLKPAEVLFIDDREENVNQARAAGIRVLRFQSVPRLREDLRRLGFTILPR